MEDPVANAKLLTVGHFTEIDEVRIAQELDET